MPGTHSRLQALIARAASSPALRVAVVYPVDEAAVQAALDAQERRLIVPILVGPKNRILHIAASIGVDVATDHIHDTVDDPHIAADIAVALARNGVVDALAKGSLHSDDLLRAVIAKSSGMHTSAKFSHCFWFDVPAYHKPLIVTDAVVTVLPTLIKKKAIVANAVALAQCLGVVSPKVAILSAVETPTPAIPTTLEAGALIEWATQNLPTAQVDGPFAFDNAISQHAAQVKGITSSVAGDADILLVPNLEAGNILYKSLVYMGGAECAGLVMGAKVPILLTSRADSPIARVASCALAVLMVASARGHVAP